MAGGLGGTAIYRDNTRKSASLDRYQPNIANNVAKRTVLLNMLKDRVKTYTGGTSVSVRFRYAEVGKLGANTNVGAWNYYDKLTVQPFDVVKTGTEAWSNFNSPVTISHEEQIENSGKNEFNLTKEATEIAMDELAKNENDVAWGVAGGDTSKYPTSIPEIVSGNLAGTIHGLSKAANTWLYSQYQAAIGAASTNLLDAMTVGYNSCIDAAPMKSADKLDGWVTDEQVYAVIQSILPAYVEYGSNKNVDIGFPSLIYMGIKVQFDSTCPDDSDGNHQMFGLMTKYWEMAVEKTMNYKTTPFYDLMPYQPVDCAQILHRWATICSVPRTNWWGYGITI